MLHGVVTANLLLHTGKTSESTSLITRTSLLPNSMPPKTKLKVLKYKATQPLSSIQETTRLVSTTMEEENSSHSRPGFKKTLHPSEMHQSTPTMSFEQRVTFVLS